MAITDIHRIIISEGYGKSERVTASALFRRDSEWTLFVVEGNRAHPRRVEVGRRTGLEAEIVSGLAEGDPVVSHPPDTVSDGTRVKAR